MILKAVNVTGPILNNSKDEPKKVENINKHKKFFIKFAP